MRARFIKRNPVLLLLIVANTIMGAVVLGIVLLLMASATSDAAAVRDKSTQTADLLRVREQVAHTRLFVAAEEVRTVRQGGRPIPEESLTVATTAVWDMNSIARLVDFTAIDGGEAVGGALNELNLAFVAYLNEQAPEARAALETAAATAAVRLKALDPLSEQEGDARMDGLVASLKRLQWVTIVLVLLVIAAMEFATWKVGRRFARIVATLYSREAELVTANRNAERRNAQFGSLYYIVSEVMETLSIKYVVDTTVREARKLVGAEVVILRILEDGRLRTRGVETAAGIDLTDVADDLGLGEGLAGRAAKRGRTVQLEVGAKECEYVDGREDGTKTGVIVPLIVGARVVGTISCWSPAAGEFTADDVQVLEMMASQVATAIAAAELHEASEREAHHDPLTTLPNRRQLSLDIRYEFDAAVRRGREMAVAMLDIDRFKHFNDEHGHQAGDAALQHVASILIQQVRKKDQIYRYGGEEFVIVFDSLSLAEARDACERLLRVVEGSPVPGLPGARLTVSAGIVAMPGPWPDFDSVLRSADEALYAAKESGRNRIVAFNQPSSGEAPIAA